MKPLILLLLMISIGCKHKGGLTMDISKADSIRQERRGKVVVITVYETDTAYVNPFDEARDMPMQDDYRDSGGGNRIDSNIVIGPGEYHLPFIQTKHKTMRTFILLKDYEDGLTFFCPAGTKTTLAYDVIKDDKTYKKSENDWEYKTYCLPNELIPGNYKFIPEHDILISKHYFKEIK